MTPNEILMLKAMNFEYPERIPVSVSILPAAWIKYGQELARLVREYPGLAPTVPDLDHIEKIIPASYHYGSFTDEWGCKWENLKEGMESIVTGHPLPNREDILKTKMPDCRDGRLPHGFMYLRILDLRGFEEAMLDFAEECEELDILIKMILDYNLIQLDVALPKMDRICYLGDDLGMQDALAIGPRKWRKYLKPCFKAIYEKVHASGRKVYMHTDGCIYEIMPDLYEVGADMINPQIGANKLDNLERVCKGKIPINVDLDRQIFPFATPSALDDHVRECVERLYLPQGGLGLNIEFNHDMPLENMAAVLEAARKYREYKG